MHAHTQSTIYACIHTQTSTTHQKALNHFSQSTINSFRGHGTQKTTRTELHQDQGSQGDRPQTRGGGQVLF